MRVGYLTYGLDRELTGIGRYAVNLLCSLVNASGAIKIILLTTEQEDRYGLWSRFERAPLPGCRLLPSLITSGNIFVSETIRRQKLDLIHDPNGIAPFLGPAWGARRITTIHDAIPFVYPQSHNQLDNWRYRLMLPRAARAVDLVLTVSESARSDLCRFLGLSMECVQVIGEAPEPTFAPVPTDTYHKVLERYHLAQPYLFYLGGLNGRKNIPRLLEAYAQLRERHPAVALVVAGKRQWKSGEIDATFQRLDLEGKVHFTGYVDDADLPALYSAAEVFVFPSLYEGFGLPPLEAMACGTPVVTSNVSSLPEVVGDAALTVDPYDVPALAAAMERALTDTALRADLRAKGLARAAQFTWERTARETLAVYEQVLEQAPRSERRIHAR